MPDRKPTKKTAAPRKAAATKNPPSTGSGNTPPSAEALRGLIAEVAYFKAKARGFAPGYEMQDWAEAEKEVLRRLDRKS